MSGSVSVWDLDDYSQDGNNLILQGKKRHQVEYNSFLEVEV